MWEQLQAVCSATSSAFKLTKEWVDCDDCDIPNIGSFVSLMLKRRPHKLKRSGFHPEFGTWAKETSWCELFTHVIC